MPDKADAVFKIWKNNTTYQVKEYSPNKMTKFLQHFSSLFSLGPFYYYVLNFHDLSIDYAHHSTQDLLGVPSREFSMETLLDRLTDNELEGLRLKEALVADFFEKKISREEIPNYKVVYFFQAFDSNGNLRTFLHQVTTIKQTEEGRIEHVLGIHMDVSDLNIIKNDSVSFIGYGENPSYYNIDPSKEPYDYTSKKEMNTKLSELLGKREIEIVSLLAKGYSSKIIAEKLFISENTVSTHRKNILRKTGAKSTPELVSRCLLEQVV
jgi:DNA-binding CsgD family transcriptional regulator